MDILKAATDWAKAEVFSSTFFVLFGVLFLMASIGFWQWGKTEVARAFVFPTMVAGILLLILGLGLVFSTKSRAANFSTDYETDTLAFVQADMARTEKTVGDYQTAVFKVFPIIIVVASLSIVFIDKPIWRAIGITTIAMMVILMFVDSNAKARIEAYNHQLKVVEQDLKK